MFFKFSITFILHHQNRLKRLKNWFELPTWHWREFAISCPISQCAYSQLLNRRMVKNGGLVFPCLAAFVGPKGVLISKTLAIIFLAVIVKNNNNSERDSSFETAFSRCIIKSPSNSKIDSSRSITSCMEDKAALCRKVLVILGFCPNSGSFHKILSLNSIR